MKIKTILILIFTVVILSGCTKNKSSLPKPSPSPVAGNNKDAHGCISSAGFTWCETKNTCLRTSEKECFANVHDEIKFLLAKKYHKPLNQVTITISRRDDNYASGSVLFGQSGLGESGLFLARKKENNWELVFDGNGSINCNKMQKEYGFPDTILKPNFCN